MPTADVFCRFAGEAATGVLAFLPAVTVREGGRRFFEVGLAIAASALVLGHGVRALAGGFDLVGTGAAALSLALVGIGWKVLRGTAFEKSKPWLAAAAALGAVSVGADALAGKSLVALPVAVASAAAGAALLGSVALAMVLGHFYLVIPRLTIDPLRRLTNGYLAAILARTAIAGVVLALVWNVQVSPGRSLLLDEATMLLPRILFGIAGPLLLCFLARGTVAIKSTQSATGILYGATVLVVVGELTAAWLAVNSGFPL